MDASVTSWDMYDQFRETVTKLARERVAPHAAEIDQNSEPPIKAFEAFKEAGLVGLAFPEDLGGQGGDLMAQVIAVEEVGRVCSSSALTLMTGWAALDPLVRFGSKELQREIIPSVARGDMKAGWCLTEPQGGTDVAGIKTRAIERDGGWVLSG